MIGMSDHDNHAEESDQSIDGWQTNICHPPSLPAEPLVSTHMQDVFFSLKNLIFHLHIYDFWCSLYYVYHNFVVFFVSLMCICFTFATHWFLVDIFDAFDFSWQLVEYCSEAFVGCLLTCVHNILSCNQRLPSFPDRSIGTLSALFHMHHWKQQATYLNDNDEHCNDIHDIHNHGNDKKKYLGYIKGRPLWLYGSFKNRPLWPCGVHM